MTRRGQREEHQYYQALHGGAPRPREGAPSQEAGERWKRVKFSECIM